MSPEIDDLSAVVGLAGAIEGQFVVEESGEVDSDLFAEADPPNGLNAVEQHLAVGRARVTDRPPTFAPSAPKVPPNNSVGVLTHPIRDDYVLAGVLLFVYLLSNLKGLRSEERRDALFPVRPNRNRRFPLFLSQKCVFDHRSEESLLCESVGEENAF